MNSVCLSGYIKRIGTVREVSGDNKVIDIAISVRKQSQTRDGRKYDVFKCVCWRGNAEYIEKYAREGEFCVVSGQLSVNQYDDKDGKKVYDTFINVADIQIPKFSDTTSKEFSEKSMEEGYVDVGRTSAKTVNDMYKGGGEFDVNPEELPF